MAERLHAIPEILSQLGAALADRGQSLLDLHLSSHRDVDGAQPGWVGSSAGELSGLLDRWAAASAGQLARLGEHSDGMRLAAVELTELERGNAASLR